MCVLVAKSCMTLCYPMGCSPPVSSVHGIFPGNNSRVGCHFLPQRIFLTQGSNLGLLHCRLYCLGHQGSYIIDICLTMKYYSVMSKQKSCHLQHYGWTERPPRQHTGKDPACHCRRHKRGRFHPWVGMTPWKRKWKPLQYSCLQNSMLGHSPWGPKGSDMTEHTQESTDDHRGHDAKWEEPDTEKTILHNLNNPIQSHLHMES